MQRRYRFTIIGATACALAIIAVLINSWSRIAPHEPVPIPLLGEEPIRLRVAYVHNPRLPRLSDEQIASSLRLAAQGAKTFFGVDVRFDLATEVPIEKLMQRGAAKITAWPIAP